MADSKLWESFWKSQLHDCLKNFLWRVFVDILPTKDVLSRRIGIGDSSCIVCGTDLEMAIHLFRDCAGFRALTFACKWGCKVENWLYASVQELVELCINPHVSLCEGEMIGESFTTFVTCLLYYF